MWVSLCLKLAVPTKRSLTSKTLALRPAYAGGEKNLDDALNPL